MPNQAKLLPNQRTHAININSKLKYIGLRLNRNMPVETNFVEPLKSRGLMEVLHIMNCITLLKAIKNEREITKTITEKWTE